MQEILGCILEIAKRNTLHTFTVIPKRWVVERSFAWIEKCRRLWKNCERKLHTSLNMVVLALKVGKKNQKVLKLIHSITLMKALK
ncbi:hypothetical protein RHABOEDO_000230 [Candidatus Rhabdochlamydia oedothoracis]|uniref:Transposase IS4-like domain-containing protein n=1 Tax=Candidatus Rhabdochlamydia oedothoracis TaxID=2720720 RepID=A0ABX8V0V3_9BACT|nr:hypothetical protein RHABOEDO_000230 [Candidatus Rhabdochlamydia oedothoracis]